MSIGLVIAIVTMVSHRVLGVKPFARIMRGNTVSVGHDTIKETVMGAVTQALAQPQLSPEESNMCLGALFSSGFRLRDYDNYPNFFSENSSMTLAQTGTYQGIEDIKEYLQFGEEEPYGVVRQTVETPHVRYVVTSFNEQGRSCTALLLVHQRASTTDIGGAVTYENLVAFKLYIDLNIQKVTTANIWHGADFMRYSFDALFNNHFAKKFICTVLRENCSSVWSANVDKDYFTDHASCVAKLDALPTTDGVLHYVDGNSLGCRLLHAELARSNDHHCAHISFLPMEDPHGRIKCQESAGILPSILFASDELDLIKAFAQDRGFPDGASVRQNCSSTNLCPPDYTCDKGSANPTCKPVAEATTL